MEQKRDFFKLRDDFPILKQTMHSKSLVYFDTAATSQKPRQVIDKICDFMSNQYGTVHRAVYELSIFATSEYSKIRESVQKFINAKYPEEIIYTRGTTDSINLVAASFGRAFIKPGDEILLSEIEHHSNIVPWQILCEQSGAIIKVIPVNDLGEIDLDSYKLLLTEKTKIVSIAHTSNALGTIHPIKTMIKMAHDVGAKVLIDGAQAASHAVVDVQDLDCDFYTFSGHKIYGPTGIGILYGKRDLLNAMPPYQGGGDMIQSVSFTKTVYNTLPFKFEAGTPMVVEVVGLGAALEYIQNIGLENIANYEHELLVYSTQRMQEIEGLKIIGRATNKGPIISFVVDGVHPLDIGTMLDLKGIAIRTGHHCAQPCMKRFKVEGTARVSFGLYNTKEEIDYFIESLKSIIKKLR